MSTPSPDPTDPQPDPLDQPDIEQQQEQSNSIGNEVGNAVLSDPIDLYELAKGAVDLIGDVIKNIDLDISL